jgi:hypothetical protein
MGEMIASETLFGQGTSGERFQIKIEIGRPYKFDAGSPTEWACPFKAEPFLVSKDAHGEGSLQALCLALYLVRYALANFIEEGGKLSFEDGQRFQLENFWPNIDLS